MFKIIHFLFLFVFSSFVYAQSIATYTVTFTSDWQSPNHGTLPLTAHWSNMVGATHNNNVTFWELGQLASPGIENVAELGSNSAFMGEVNGSSDANQWIQFAFDPPNDESSGVSFSIDVSEDYPLLTLISMIAPSPDWFIGISNYSLLDGSSAWKDNITIDIFPFDAGTEDGSGYNTTNAATSPHVVIFDRTSTTPFTGPRIGMLSINLDSVLNVNSLSFEESLTMAPNPATDILTIKTKNNNVLKNVSIFNVLGKQVATYSFNNSSESQKLNISNLASGLYIVKIQDNANRSMSKKLIIN